MAVKSKKHETETAGHTASKNQELEAMNTCSQVKGNSE